MSDYNIALGLSLGIVAKGLGSLTSVETSLKTLDKFVEKLNAQKINIGANTTGLDALEARIKSVNRSIENIKDAKNKLEEIDKDRAKYKGQIADALALGYALYKPLKASIEFEEAMADVKKVVDFTDESLKVFEDGLVSMSQTIPLSMNELARIAASGGQMGIAQESLLQFTERAMSG
ncbi:MAG: phage tail tape measure protein [Helicobacteraceae bacterium]|jgi:prefoldin subunit 5|nr:phage tail tape measure protein [Helicobacteraceae bacterium]